MSTPNCTSTMLWGWAWRATARLQHWHERIQEWRWFQLNALIGCTHGSLVSVKSILQVWWLRDKAAANDRQRNVWQWGLLQVSAWHDSSYIHSKDFLLDHDLCVKFSPYPCSHSKSDWTSSYMSGCGWPICVGILKFVTCSCSLQEDAASFLYCPTGFLSGRGEGWGGGGIACKLV